MSAKPREPGNRPATRWPLIIITVALSLTIVPLLLRGSGGSTETVPLRALAEEIQAGQAERIIVRSDSLILVRPDDSRIESRKEAGVGATEALELVGISPADLQDVQIEVDAEGGGLGSVAGLLFGLIPLLFLVVIGYFVWRQFSQANKGMTGITKSKARLIEVDGKKPDVTFDDVAGCDESKRELQEVVEFLKDSAKFNALGARIPRGVLLVGPPGTGKTLLAKAVAGEASVPFLTVSGSDFVELFVGAGAAKVRDLFATAKKVAPSIVFIDEVDAVGRRRGIGIGNGNDEREQTLNQILVEMDGFETGTDVIVIAATNRADVLDEALLRPGRFDRRVTIDKPDVEGREAILKVHSKDKPLASEKDLKDLAKLTVGFSGADLGNLMNESAILAARRGLQKISLAEMNDAFERLITGSAQGRVLSAEDREVIAHHEAGHALVMEMLPEADPVHKVSIVAHGAALGYTMPLPEKDRVLRSKEAFEDEIAGLLGGRAAEELHCGRLTTGAANDLGRATEIAKAMVTRYGMSEAVGLRTFGANDGAPGGGGWPTPVREYAEGTALKVDAAIDRILDQAYQRAKTIILESGKALKMIAEALLEQETLDRADLDKVVLAAFAQEPPKLAPQGDTES